MCNSISIFYNVWYFPCQAPMSDFVKIVVLEHFYMLLDKMIVEKRLFLCKKIKYIFHKERNHELFV
jgi:hypothetical protein